MKIKLGKLAGIKAALNAICELDIVAETSYWLGRFASRITSEDRDYNVQVSKLQDKHGRWKAKVDGKIYILQPAGKDRKRWETEDGQPVDNLQVDPRSMYFDSFTNEDYDVYKEELDKLAEVEIEVNIDPIKLSNLVTKVAGKEEPINIKAWILRELDQIIENDKKEKKAA